ncbi:ankyrin repeat domain-containing protein [Actinobacillus equuli]|uniref:HTH-type transcriptional regulator immR n=1 Tax=Actinobacillus equuli TaxID=718 RepID=A0AAX3FIX8_ACTEU|nr:ankyrin repeat domain-containing protein [Actinobacillus equuli]AIZ79735.1 DNA-binding protein [Actinobacillus equuli subsp. equuli]WGE43845.1 ankyrin repeat domain-containing protein [Actinobacillus equuli subsp. equuli]VEE90546.1 HTH-type transcriptional regulator immR [Actinobacillus equuli]
MITETIGTNIKTFREKYKMSQQDLADKMNIARPVISNWEHGKTEPSSSQLLKLARIFDASTDKILGNTSGRQDIVVVDTSALIKRPSFTEELLAQFDEVIIPDIVISELNYQKDKGKDGMKQNAWLIMANIDKIKTAGKSNLVISKNIKTDGNNDEKIADIAIRKARANPSADVYLLSDDIYFQFLASHTKNVIPITPKNYLLQFGNTNQDIDLVKSIEFFALVKANKLAEVKVFDLTHVDINLHDPDSGFTPLIAAVRNRNLEMIKFLSGLPNIDMDKQDKYKYCFSAIHHAAQLKDLSVIKLLATYQTDIDLGSSGKNAGNTPLMIAAWSGFKEGVEFFLSQGACANQQDSNGFTALIKACIKNNASIINQLADKTDKQIRSRENKRAVDYLNPNKINYQQIQKLFKEAK